MKLRNFGFLVAATVIGCAAPLDGPVNPSGGKSGDSTEPICSYNSVQEPIRKKRERLGNTEESGCLEVVPGHNDINRDRINIVFVGVNYTEDKLAQKVQDSLDCEQSHKGFLSIPIYATNLETFNFWYVSESAKVEKGKYSEGVGAFGGEARAPAAEAAESCDLPKKAVIALVNWNFRSNTGFSSLRYINLEQMNLDEVRYLQEKYSGTSISECEAKIDECKKADTGTFCYDVRLLRGTQDPELDKKMCGVLTGDVHFGLSVNSEISTTGDHYLMGHEEGHAILGLRDEYEDSGYLSFFNQENYYEDLKSNPVNCFVGTEEECKRESPWVDKIGEEGIGCFQGCGYGTEVNGVPVWRSIELGLMRGNTPVLGIHDEERGCMALHAAVPGNVEGICRDYGYVRAWRTKRIRFNSALEEFLESQDSWMDRGYCEEF